MENDPKQNLLKPEKMDSDDTSSNGTDDSDNYEVSARRSRRATRRQYKTFVRENKGFWMWFNLTIVLFSIGLSVGTYFIVKDPEAPSCGGIKMVLWAVICLHFMNSLMCLVNLCGMEVKLCNSNMVCCFSIFELTMLVWMQVTYFRSQEYTCMVSAPKLYFWLMFQILCVYIGMGLVVCHFFRKFCQDPDEEELEEGVDEEAFDPQDAETAH
uniref:Uncharacterized protein n=1 Tax=Strombidium inclinatum TaxID=197538 RepID=A0A7S3N4K5_9SPIT|mmetsp:Transcript_5411/g.8375  ORF Transcript_5411/g.8375 Transcript_5411/m.8375 type:complete len:212 (+) Transcript_5411:33-668(+)|eukprot:CAMPEP_0170491378 /NCGR_PEP_ID=MMETSP0208-20121228/10915_1 /TAXON_ID=197538 /ORGANISM="Strombidium inclinatum, Strain S3" /LENGTH=211 /DNA_ID=CAMNT_0010766943 /DNA_START=13 /DNA_END=648 /DNA_ORIENTATION=-